MAYENQLGYIDSSDLLRRGWTTHGRQTARRLQLHPGSELSWRRNSQATIERDLGYAKRLNLNSTRVWLNYTAYERNPADFLKSIQNYIRTSHRLGISTMPILWNGNGLNPDTLKPEFRARGDVYVKAVVEVLKDEPGLLMWDVMNE